MYLFLEFSKKPLDDYLEANLTKVKAVHLPERSGLIRARLAGAKAATAEVLIFLDSHTEANVNWLPPLLGSVYIISKNLGEILIIIFQNQLHRITKLVYALSLMSFSMRHLNIGLKMKVLEGHSIGNCTIKDCHCFLKISNIPQNHSSE